MVQKSKGGGLASSFAGSNQIMGVRRTNDFIEKATWSLAAIIALLAITLGVHQFTQKPQLVCKVSIFFGK